MARVYQFAQKEYGINSELITLEGHDDAAFTYNGNPIRPMAALILSTNPIAQNVLNNADSLLTWNTITQNTGTGITLPAGVVTITKAGVYTLQVVIKTNAGYAGGQFAGGFLKVGGTIGTIGAVNVPLPTAVAAGQTQCSVTFFKQTAGTQTITLTVNGTGTGGTATGYQIVENELDLVYAPTGTFSQ